MSDFQRSVWRRKTTPGAEWELVRHVTVRGSRDPVLTIADKMGVVILYGRDGINATIRLDYGEARELAEAILEGVEEWVGIKEGRHES